MLVWAGFSLSVVNAFFVYTRKRHYRLFEANIDQRPDTQSANRVRVQSSPSTNSHLRLINDLVHLDSAESRAHPDSTRDVWELAVWDPRPASLALLSFFSPLHVLIYLFELPLDPLEPRPSVAVFKCLVLQVSLSMVMRLMQARNDQRQRDNAIIQKEVLHEYNTKFVQPRLHPVVRDMGTQVTMDQGVDSATTAADTLVDEAVETGTPTTMIQRGFQTHPNANYLKHIDPDFASRGSSSSLSTSASLSRLTSRLSGRTAAATPVHRTPVPQKEARYTDSDSPSSFTPRQSNVAQSRQAMPLAMPLATTPKNQFASISTSTGSGADPRTGPRNSTGPVVHTPLATINNGARLTSIPSSATTNFGGSMGVYSHVNSPLKKTISMNDIGHSPRNSREMAALEQREAVERMQRRAAAVAAAASSPSKSPQKDSSFQPPQELPSPPVPYNPFAKTRPGAQNRFERFPKRW